MSSGRNELAVELERAALRALASAYETINANFFDGELRRPVLMLKDSMARLGQWDGAHRTLELSRQLLMNHEWGSVIEVLKHEMAHQYVDEVLGGEPLPHGPVFQRVCRERNFDRHAAGVPRSRVSGGRADILLTISRLLALAESPNQNEAEVAMKTAQRLMLKYNIESVSDVTANRYCFRHLGQPTGRVHEAERLMAIILAEHFFVEVIWVSVWRVAQGKRGSVLEVCGTDDNVELASYVHAFLEHTSERLWREHKRERDLRSNRERREFRAGVMAGFRDKLDAEKRANQRRGLVWAGDPQAERYLRGRHPHVRTSYFGGSARGEAHRAGREAGRELVLHRGVRQGPEAASRPRLLTR